MSSIKSELRHRATPFMAWLREVRDLGVLRADTLAGISVALVLVPQSMAYAQLAGLPAYVGLYASFLPVIIASLWGSSRQLGTGPVAVVSLMTAAALEPIIVSNGLSGDEALLTYLALAALMAILIGIFQLVLGLLRLGILVDFLSHPVIVGFTNGAAVIIATSQLDKLFGVERPRADLAYEQVWGVLVNAVEATHLPTLSMGLLALAMMIVLKKTLPRAPGVLITMVATIILATFVGYAEKGGAVVGHIPAGLPGIAIPTQDLGDIGELVIPAIFIALIGFMEAISIARAMAAQTRQHLDANQELVGQGLANIAAGLFQAYPVSGSFSRSAVNISAGAQTGFSMVVTGIVVATTLLFFTPLLYNLPLATLAAVIIMAVAGLVKIAPIRHALRVQKSDGIIAIATFALTLLVAPRVEEAIAVGVILSLIVHLYRTMHPRFAELSLHPDGTLRDAVAHKLETSPVISVFRFDGSLYFADAGYLENRILESIASKPELKYVIIDAEGINHIDATGEAMLRNMAQQLRNIGIELFIARAKKQIMDVFERSGFVDILGRENFFRRCRAAIDRALESCDMQQVQDSPLRVPHPRTTAKEE